MNLQRRILYRKIFIAAIATVLVLLLVLPFSASWPVETASDPGSWKADYVLADVELVIGLGPFYLLFGVYPIVRNRFLQITLRILLILLAAFYFFYGRLAIRLPVQDFAPDVGILLLFPLLPLLILLFYHERRIQYPKKEGHRN